ncbi:TRMT1-like protein isoform X2 [Oryzias melastigma]|uniref:TRMT1-like protein isoform X2 n=1 Tax=Oryzias melastigma TaxID=30732 RepID=UPI00168CC277|nr:TRMT1-like protein isoform X2 [Oryzias melastigma]
MSTLDFPVTVLSHKRRAVPLIHFSVSKAEDVGVTEHEADSSEAAADTKPSTTTERHISIQTKLEGLEMLVDLNEGRKSCPLCPEEKFKACYSHKLRRHLQNLHWKVFVEFEGFRMCICHLPCRNLKPSVNGDQVRRPSFNPDCGGGALSLLATRE